MGIGAVPRRIIRSLAIVIVLTAIALLLTAYFSYLNRFSDLPRNNGDLAAERAAFHTNLVRRAPSPEAYPELPPPPAGCVDTTFPSGNLRLRAWMSADPNDGKRHPAIVYLHGNFGFEPGHWQCTSPWRDAGYVVLTPMLRGENGNPGSLEMFWGEVDDVVAAGNYLAAIPYVDQHRIFLAGHSVGGTLTMLTAMVRSPYAAAAAFSGSPNQRRFMRDMPANLKVYDTTDPRELQLRSPICFPNSIRCPLYLFAGDQEQWCIGDTREFAARAARFGKICTFELVPGDHRSSKPLEILRALKIFNSCADKPD